MLRYVAMGTLAAVLAIGGCPGGQGLQIPIEAGTYSGTLECTAILPDGTTSTSSFDTTVVMSQDGVLNVYDNDMIVGETYVIESGESRVEQTIEDIVLDGGLIEIQITGSAETPLGDTTFAQSVLLEQPDASRLLLDDLFISQEADGEFRENCVGTLTVE